MVYNVQDETSKYEKLGMNGVEALSIGIIDFLRFPSRDSQQPIFIAYLLVLMSS
jgi:hypothetical protein